MDDRLYWPVRLEDCCKWYDEQIVEYCHIKGMSSASTIKHADRRYHRDEMRTVPGSLEYTPEQLTLRMSHIYWKVIKSEFEAITAVYGIGRVWHERYQLCYPQYVDGVNDHPTDEEIGKHLLYGLRKPWNVPFRFVRDGANIVLLRAERVEDWLQHNFVNLTYVKGCLITDTGDMRCDILDRVAIDRKKR